MHAVQESAHAKLNLSLHIYGKRADSYHLLESLVCFLSLADRVTAEQADVFSIAVTGEFATDAGDGDGNLVLKAARALQAYAGTTHAAMLTLEKHIPVGAGLGGGSADAAATLRALNQLWQLNLPQATLIEIARPLGADVAMCVASTPAYAHGVGDALTPLAAPLPQCWLVLAHPRTPLLTADVYRTLNAQPVLAAPVLQTPAMPLTYAAIIAFLNTQRNDLEAPALQLSTAVRDILEALRATHADLVRMTGSGACCFGLYDTQARAMAAAAQLTRSHPHWWVTTATTRA